MNHTEMMATVFRGRTDAFFADVAVREPVTLDVLRRHLNGEHNMGIYPVLDDQTCYWGCADIDDDDYDRAVQFARVAESAGLTGWIERSKSKGYHVWVFCYEPVPAPVMRAAMQFVDRMAGTSIDELNPKGDGGGGTLVNCVRLPYFGGGGPDRQVIIDSFEAAIPMEEFIEEAFDLRSSRDGVQYLADKQGRFERAHAPLPRAKGAAGRRATPRSGQQAARAYRGEVRIGQGQRDDTAFALANYLKSGLRLDQVDAENQMSRVWRDQFDDHASFTEDDALAKVRRLYAQ